MEINLLLLSEGVVAVDFPSLGKGVVAVDFPSLNEGMVETDLPYHSMKVWWK